MKELFKELIVSINVLTHEIQRYNNLKLGGGGGYSMVHLDNDEIYSVDSSQKEEEAV